MTITPLSAFLLGILQGLTEFLPVSSSGHLAAARLLFSFDVDPRQALAFDISVHAATLAAILLYFRKPLVLMLRGLAGETRPGEPSPAEERRLAGMILATLLPTGLVFVFFKDFLESAGGRSTTLAAAFGVTALILLATRVVPRPSRMVSMWGEMPWSFALLIGLAQGVALTPGVSRSGSTIAVALILGLAPDLAVRFSFLMVIPAILGAMAVPILEGAEGLSFGVLAAGMGGAFLVGLGSIHLLRLLVVGRKLHWFALYVAAVAVVILVAG